MASNLGELLLREKILSVDQLKSALEFQKKNSLPVGTSLVQLGYLTEEDIAQALSRQLGYPYIDLDQFDVYAEVITLIPVDVAKKYMIMPIHRIRNFLTLAMVDPTDLEIIEDVRFRTGLSIQPVIASETGVVNAINKYYGTADAIRVKKIIEDIALADDGRVNIIEDDNETDVLDGRGHTRPKRPRSSSSSTRPSSTPSSGARATSISSPTRRASASATAWTATSTRSSTCP